jgi:hypothetical protein
MLIVTLWRSKVPVKSSLVNWLPWTPLCLSTGDLGLIDLLVAPHDEGEDLAGDVAFQGPNGFKLRMSFSDTFGQVGLCFGSVRKRPIAMMCKALLAARSPPLFRRCRMVVPDEGGTGLVPQSAEIAADIAVIAAAPAPRARLKRVVPPGSFAELS